MRRLMLLRHAKATRSPEFVDYDRPLDRRGQKGAVLLGGYMASSHLFPEAVLVSPSVRTRETWDIVKNYIAKIEPDFDDELYHASAGTILSYIRNTPADVKCLMVIGHNPGFADLAEELAGMGDRFALANMRTKFATSGLAVMDFNITDWRQVRSGDGRLVQFITPKMLGIDE